MTLPHDFWSAPISLKATDLYVVALIAWFFAGLARIGLKRKGEK